MKRLSPLFLLASLLLSVLTISAQNWTDNLPQYKIESGEELTFFEIQKAFNDYWDPLNVQDGYYLENGIRKKAAGWKQFKRWEWFWEMRIDPMSGAFPKTSAAEIRKQIYITADARNVSGNWMSLGPTTAAHSSVGLGRLNCIAFADNDIDRFYVGSPSGGVWRTTDGGGSWEVLTDDNDALGASDILVYAGTSAATDTLYIATGDRDGGSLHSLGGDQVHDNNTIGVLKSVDGGATWATTDLEWLPSDKKTVNRLLKHPGSSDSIYATGSDGVFLTTDGGATWPKLAGTFEFIDMEFNPADPGILYGSTRFGKVYKSSDKGITWDLKLDVFGAKRVELAVSDDMPGWVYAVVVASTSGLEGIHKSEDAGETWTKVFDGSLVGQNLLGSLCDGTSGGGQGTYDLALAAKPDDASTLYVGGINTWKSTDGGSTWSINNHWTGSCGAPTVHADKHWLVYQPGTGDLFECNDGGVNRSVDGATWTNLSNGLGIGQLYRIGVSHLTSNNTIAGFQDNGTHSLLSGSWEWVISGDGMECFIDHTDDDTQYGSIYYGRIFRTTDGWSTPYTEITSGLSGFAAWVSPFTIDPITNTTIYVARDTVWKSLDQGASWSKISDFYIGGTTFRSMAVAPSNPDTIYAATRTKIWATYNGGTSWIEITGTLPVGSSFITYISVNSDFADTLWVAMGEYNIHGVYQSTDAGASWTNISAGLPSIPVMSVVQNRQNTSEIELYAATDVGVYVKVGSGAWTLYSAGLPNVVVTEIEIYYDDTNPNRSRLRAATFGRGLWETELYAPPGSSPIADFNADVRVPLLDSAVAFTDISNNDPTSWSWSFTPSTVTYLNGTSSSSQNPMVSFDAAGDYDVELTATNAGGSDVETKTAYISVVAPYKWTGGTSTDWSTASNWDSGVVPDESKHVVIEAGATFYPELLGNFYVGSTGGVYNCKSLTIESGGLLAVSAVPVPYFDMYVYGDVTIKTGGTLKTGDDLSVESGGNLFVTGGTVENFVNTTGGYGDLYFKSGSGGYMTAGSITVFSDLILYSGSNWYASGGALHFGGSASIVKTIAYNSNMYINDLVVDADVSAYISTSSTAPLTMHGDFIMESGSMYSVSSGETLFVQGDVWLKSNAAGAASLINFGTLTVLGTSTVERFMTDGKWSIISSPVSGETLSALYFSDSPKTWVQKYMESTNTWSFITALGTPLTQGRGWSCWIDPASRSDVTVSFSGPLLSTDLTLSSFDYSGDAAHGYNVVGNPFPSAIDWDIGSWDTTGINGNIWVWEDGGAGDGSGTYLYRNAQGMGSLTDGIIPVAQGFFIQTTSSSASLTIPADARVHSSTAFYSPKAELPMSYLVMEVQYLHKKDEAWIAFNPGLSDQFDNGWDVNKLLNAGPYPQLYVAEGDHLLSINALAPLEKEYKVVPLHFQPGNDGEHSLRLSGFNKMGRTKVMLEDLYTGDFQDIVNENEYVFFANTGDDPQRFLLHFNPLVTGIETQGEEDVNIYAYQQAVYIRSDVFSNDAVVFLYDLYGREIAQQKLVSGKLNKIGVNQSFAYIIVKTVDQGNVHVKKLFIQ